LEGEAHPRFIARFAHGDYTESNESGQSGLGADM
jgi:hypothetical protein